MYNFDQQSNAGYPLLDDEDNAWIPAGILFDLADNNLNNDALIIDNVSGYTLDDLIISLTQELQNLNRLEIMENRLIDLIPTGKTENDLEILFDEYGY